MYLSDILMLIQVILLAAFLVFLIIEFILTTKKLKIISGRLKVFTKWYKEHFGEEIENGKEN